MNIAYTTESIPQRQALTKSLLLLVLEKAADNTFSLSPERLQYFQKENITEIAILANMRRYSSLEVADLQKIKTALNAKNISVSFIATPADTAWHINDAILNRFYISGFNLTHSKRVRQLRQNEFTQIASLFENPSVCQNQPGIAFHSLEIAETNVSCHEKAFQAHWAVEKMCKMNLQKYASPMDFACAQLKSYYKQSQQTEIVVLKDNPVELVEDEVQQRSNRCVIL